MTADEAARRLLERAGKRRASVALDEAESPVFARAVRRIQAERGVVSQWDDPLIEVRCSEIEAVCRPLLGLTEPEPAEGGDQ